MSRCASGLVKGRKMTNESPWLIALVEDDAEMRRQIKEYLEGELLQGRPIRVAETGSFEEALDLLATRASAKNLELAHWIDPDVPDFIEGDSLRLRQVRCHLRKALDHSGETFVVDLFPGRAWR